MLTNTTLWSFLIGFAAAGTTAAAALIRLASKLHSTEKQYSAEHREWQALVGDLTEKLHRAETDGAAAEAALRVHREGAAQTKSLADEVSFHLDQRVMVAVTEAVDAGTHRLMHATGERAARESAEQRRDHAAQASRVRELLGPVAGKLDRVEQLLNALERDRISAHAALDEQLKELGLRSDRMVAGTNSLVTALRRPHIRGTWGENTLRNVVEEAGMTKHIDFVEQPTIAGQDGDLRPDMIIRLPGGRQVVVDAKVPMEALLEARQADDPEDQREALKRHARQLAAHLRNLGSKKYWAQLTGSPELVFAFVPSDQVYLAALEVDKSILTQAACERLVIATPMTLIALLKLAAFGWRQEQITARTEEVLRAARDIHERLQTFSGHLDTHSRHLETAVKSWNALLGSHESRLVPAARRLSDLGVVDEPEGNPARRGPVATAVRAPGSGAANATPTRNSAD